MDISLNEIGIELRQARKEDIGFIYELMHSELAQLFNENTSEGWSRNKFKKTYNPERYFIFEHDNMPIGFINLEVEEKEIYCGGLCISRDYQGRGLGTTLLSKFLEKYKLEGYELFKGKIFKDNSKSLSMVKKINFSIEKDIPEENSYHVRRILR